MLVGRGGRQLEQLEVAHRVLALPRGVQLAGGRYRQEDPIVARLTGRLAARLAALGWQSDLKRSTDYFLYGSGGPL